ncbi:hypothetical protein [Bradyrhizobium cosmicum]|uniref:hypothetical protein n=1 Tax=Bradyrhizobium cosmicum TaxID=1404864 RepID=UPI001164EC24|nr:hypothetical protein [Bradyrhizobium cosmicum]QDP22781.1 hypothetical protein FNV92_11710 [Bradyrhizobium cosmicum]
MRLLGLAATAAVMATIGLSSPASARLGIAPLADTQSDALIQVRHGHGHGHGGWHRNRGHHYGWYRGRGNWRHHHH